MRRLEMEDMRQKEREEGQTVQKLRKTKNDRK